MVIAILLTLAGLPDDDAFFESKVRPLLIDHCHQCHASGAFKGGLSLTSRERILSGGDSGPAAVEGKPDESLLIQAVRYSDDVLKMPPKNKLSDAEVAVLVDWVKRGLPWPDSAPRQVATDAVASEPQLSEEQRAFWSFQPVVVTPPPAIKETGWPRCDIDRHILARLESAGLPHAQEADRRTLIRRATFDLTGLPPTPEEVEAFVHDPAPDAYEQLVERLLASPAYGERWARHWLDVVRYADSLDTRGSGQPGDILDAWRYRDWVVDALNADMPYDQFIRAQIAGDIAAVNDSDPASEGFDRGGVIATSLLAIGNWGNGDADKDKILTDIADDQIDVVSKAFLGLTIACARCHDHKFDPILQSDYYALAGIFLSTHILPKLTPKGAGETIMRVPLASPAELERRNQREQRIAELRTQIDTTRDQHARMLAVRLQPEAGRYLMAARDYLDKQAATAAESIESFAQSGGLHAVLLRQWADFLVGGAIKALEVRNESIGGRSGVVSWAGTPAPQSSATANTLHEEVAIASFKLPPRSISVHPGPSSHAVVSWRSPMNGRVRVTGQIADGDPVCGNGVIWSIAHRGGLATRELASGTVANGAAMALAAGNGGEKLASIDVKAGEHIDLVVARNGEYSCDTTTVDLVISSWEDASTWDVTRDCLDSFLSANPHPDRLGNPSVWSFADSTCDPVSLPPELDAALQSWRELITRYAPSSEIEAATHAFAAAFALDDARSPFWVRDAAGEALFEPAARQQLDHLRAELANLEAHPPPPLEYANAAQEGGVPESPHAGFHDVKLHIRGRYDRLGPLIPRGFPKILGGGPEPPITRGSGRLELARWLTRPDHPLTARVMANRIWQHHFGAGLVRTPSNFGKLGEPPTHPELLDYLAHRLVECGWSLKQLHREIMLSSTYRQSSIGADETIERDPDNRLLGRMNRRRLEAEAVRDNLLAVAGRLDPARGGPAERDFRTPRRGLYMITIRSDRATFGALFDQADSTASVDRRVESTVAPQALYLLNNPFVLEQAAALAARILAHAGDTPGRVDFAYRLLFARPPVTDELAIAQNLLEQAQSAGETAESAWINYCHILMCSNEFVFID